MKAFITGISGQDGAFLTEHLLGRGIEVHGLVRRNSVAENQTARLQHLLPDVKLYYGDLLDAHNLYAVISQIKPDWVFNLAAMSHVRVSFDIPAYTIKTDGLGVLNILEACRVVVPRARFYQAASSEQFGRSVDPDGYQRETTPMEPTSPYGCAKVLAYNLVRHYRHAYGMFACNGILYNHESIRRGSNFVTAKVVKTAVEIKFGLAHKLELGNLDSYRDWGHAKDYTNAQIQIIEHGEPDDFVIATGETHSVRELCQYVFNRLDMDYKNYVVQNPKYIRAEELPYLRGDASKAKRLLRWEPEYTFESLLDEMIGYWVSQLGE